MKNNEKTKKILKVFFILVLIIVVVDIINHKEFFISLKKGIEKQAAQQKIEKVIDQKELEERKEKEHNETEEGLKSIAQTFIIISIPILLISIILNFKNVHTKSYDKNLENQINPVLAEILIDNKIDFKSLIMTIIIDLHLKGNLRIINNEYIEILNTQNVEPYKKNILDLIFEDKKIISFKEINTTFKKSKEKTIEFSKVIAFIKVNIIEKLYNMGIYSRKKTAFAKLMIIFSLIIITNLPMAICANVYSFFREMAVFALIMTGLVIVYYIKKMDNQRSIMESFITESKTMVKEESRRRKKKKAKEIFSRLVIMFSYYPIIIIFCFVALLNYDIEIILLVFFTFIINICVFLLNKGYSLTPKGYEEKYKLLKLKNYINEYSLIKDRDLNSVIIWDEYLAYATAFEIPTKVTDSIYKQWYDINLTIQFIEIAKKLLIEQYKI